MSHGTSGSTRTQGRLHVPSNTSFAALVSVSLLVTAAANLAPTLVSSLAVQIQQDLQIGESELGLTVSAFFFVGVLSSALSGRLVERIGAVYALRLAAAVAAVVMLAIGAMAHTWATLVGLVAVGGLANAWAQPAANLYVARGVAVERQGLALGIQKSGIPTASLLAGLALPTVALTIGWNWAFALGGFLALAVSVAVPRAPVARASTTKRAPKSRSVGRPQPDVSLHLLVLVACSTCLAAIGSMALSSFFVLYSVEVGIDEATAGLLLMVGSVVGICARLAMGAGADRSALSPWSMLTAMFAVAAVAFVAMSLDSMAALFVAMPFAFSTSFAWPGLFHLAVVRSNPSAPSAATGLTMTGSFSGAVCGPLLFGVVVEAAGYSAAWGLMAATSAAAATAMGLVSRRIT